MWPFKKKVLVENNLLHGYDLEVWEYLGWTEIKFDGVPNSIHFFWKRGNGDERSYTLTGRPEFVLKEIAKLHRYVSDHCELWRIREDDIYMPIRTPSKFLKEWVFDNHGYVWSTEKKWWVLASDQDRYEHSVSKHQKKHPEIYTENNIVTVNFKDKNK
jgi:hypothetical protein